MSMRHREIVKQLDMSMWHEEIVDISMRHGKIVMEKLEISMRHGKIVRN